MSVSLLQTFTKGTAQRYAFSVNNSKLLLIVVDKSKVGEV